MKAIILTYRDFESVNPDRYRRFSEERLLDRVKRLKIRYFILLDVRGMSGDDRFDAVAYAERQLRELGLFTSALVQVRTDPTSQSICHGSGFSPSECVIWRKAAPRAWCELISLIRGPISIEYIG